MAVRCCVLCGRVGTHSFRYEWRTLREQELGFGATGWRCSSRWACLYRQQRRPQPCVAVECVKCGRVGVRCYIQDENTGKWRCESDYSCAKRIKNREQEKADSVIKNNDRNREV